MITLGQAYSEYRGVYDGDVYVLRHHLECRDAEIKLNRHYGLTDDDEWQPLYYHYCNEGEELLASLDPVVTARLQKWRKDCDERRLTRQKGNP
jgi:hypothetical protein